MTEPNYLGLALMFLGPPLCFLVSGLVLPPRRIDWDLVGVGLVPGVNLLVCASALGNGLRKGLRHARARGAARRAAAATRGTVPRAIAVSG